MQETVIYWYRQDLRTQDLPGLSAAAAAGKPILACYILDDAAAGEWAAGGASRWWLHHSLQALDEALQQLGGKLLLFKGDTAPTLLQLCEQTSANRVYCSAAIDPWARTLETQVQHELDSAGARLLRQPGTLLYSPQNAARHNGEPYKVFTPFWRHCSTLPAPQPAPPLPTKLQWHVSSTGITLDELSLLPSKPNWASHWPQMWQPGCLAATERATDFIDTGLPDYAENRDALAEFATSRLSAHLHFGEISVGSLWRTASQAQQLAPELADTATRFLAQLGWREFSHHLLLHNPDMAERPLQPKFASFPWARSPAALAAWRLGQTGFPVVDAGMRELWHTGYMHNRARMICASFLCKHLLLPWQAGLAWFHDTLVDADYANNAASWQWVAGCGTDAAPYIRVFNPILQGQRFDAKGEYVRSWVPELAQLPDKLIHQPWEASDDILAQAGITLGDTYPQPIVDHKAARQVALEAYASWRDQPGAEP
jgi:deoxyribodipyrimidine photo-lyase